MHIKLTKEMLVTLFIFEFKQLGVLQCSKTKQKNLATQKKEYKMLFKRPMTLSFHVFTPTVCHPTLNKNQCNNIFQCNLKVKCFSGKSGIQLQKGNFVNLHLSLASLCDTEAFLTCSFLSYSILAHFENCYSK